MNDIRDLSANVIYVAGGSTKNDVFNKIKELYNTFTQDKTLNEYNTYEDYVKSQEARMRADIDQYSATVVAPFTIVDLFDKCLISMLHCGDYSRDTDFNKLDKNVYRMDNIYEVYGCICPEVSAQDLEQTTSIDYIVKRIGGNIIVLSNKNSIPKEVASKLKEISYKEFNPFK